MYISISKEVQQSSFRQYGEMKNRGRKSQREEKRRTKKESEEETPVRNVRKGAKPYLFSICGEGAKVSPLKRQVRSHVARWEKRNCTPLARSKFLSQNQQNNAAPHFSKLGRRKSGYLCGPKHMFKSKGKQNQRPQTIFGSWNVEKLHTVVAQRKLSKCTN